MVCKYLFVHSYTRTKKKNRKKYWFSPSHFPFKDLTSSDMKLCLEKYLCHFFFFQWYGCTLSALYLQSLLITKWHFIYSQVVLPSLQITRGTIFVGFRNCFIHCYHGLDVKHYLNRTLPYSLAVNRLRAKETANIYITKSSLMGSSSSGLVSVK